MTHAPDIERAAEIMFDTQYGVGRWKNLNPHQKAEWHQLATALSQAGLLAGRDALREAAAVQAERESCAVLADKAGQRFIASRDRCRVDDQHGKANYHDVSAAACFTLAADIRARSSQK